MASPAASVFLAVGLGALVLAACTTSPPAAGKGKISTLVDIGGGRRLHLECRGSGSPTVLLVSGTRGAADEWDSVSSDAGADQASVLDAVAVHARVCAYDRPGTLRASGEATESTVVNQPTTARQGTDDLAALVTAADERGPYVVVGLSLGGLIAQDYARARPDRVEGLVLVDAASEYLSSTFSPDQWAAWMEAIRGSGDAARSEVPDYEQSLAALRAAAPLRAIPVVVMSSDHPWDLQVVPGASTWPGWVAAQAQLARSLGATHITDTDSGHGIPVEQPALVARTIVDLVETIRARAF